MSSHRAPWHRLRRLAPPIAALLFAIGSRTVHADFHLAFTSQLETRPSVASNAAAGQFAAAWVVNSGSTGTVEARVFDASGTALTPVVQPFGTWTVLTRPAVAFNNARNEYFVVDATSGPDVDGIIGRRFDAATGTLVGDMISMFTSRSFRRFFDGGASPQGVGSIRVAYNSVLDEYLVTAQLRADPANPNTVSIWGELVSGAGAIVHPAFEINFYTTPLAHGTAHAPISTTPSGGRYLVVHGTGLYLAAMLIDADGSIIVSDLPLDDGTPDHGAAYADVAYGRVEGLPRFLVVYSDSNNCKPGISSCADDWTMQQRGVWGTYVDPNRTVYNPPNTDNVVFPISNIPMHEPGYGYNVPKVAYNESSQAFFVTWVESPANDAANSGEPTLCSHIRGDWVDSLTPPQSHPDLMISDVSCSCAPPPTGPTYCDSAQDPRLPSVASVGASSAVVAWQQSYPPNPTDQDIEADVYGYAPPSNDARAAAQLVPTQGGTYPCTLAGATNDASVTCGQSSANPDIWYRYVAPSAGVVRVSTCGTHDMFGIDTGVDTVLSIHDAGGAQVGAACNDDFPSGPEPTACSATDLGLLRDSALSQAMTAGQTYWFRVSRYGASTGGRCQFNLSFAGSGAGRVPADVSWPGSPLTVSKAAEGNVALSWGNSCVSGDRDFEIYEGTVGAYYSHTPLFCSTGGATSKTLLPSAGNRYYLVVPQNGGEEGSYGVASSGVERPQKPGACLTQSIASCP